MSRVKSWFWPKYVCGRLPGEEEAKIDDWRRSMEEAKAGSVLQRWTIDEVDIIFYFIFSYLYLLLCCFSLFGFLHTVYGGGGGQEEEEVIYISKKKK